MEYRRGGSHQARTCRRPDPAAAHALRARRAFALWPGQMVSGRKPAALGVRPVLRKDGVAIWKNPDLIATIEGPRNAGIAEAERFAEAAAKRLGVNSEFIIPAF